MDNEHQPPSLDYFHPLPSLDDELPHCSNVQSLVEPHAICEDALDQEIDTKAKEEEMLLQFEHQIAENNILWETKLKACLENCQTESAEKHSLEIKQLKILHAEEVENALKANTIAYQVQIEALKELSQDGYDALLQECDALRQQLTEQTVEAQASDYQLQHIEEMERVLADFEESKKASDAEKELEIGLFRDRIEQLEKQNGLDDMEASYKVALHEKELVFQAQLQTQLALIQAQRIQYESKISLLESELKLSESEQKKAYDHQVHEIEDKHKVELTTAQTHFEQQLLEAKTTHAKEIENLQNELFLHSHEQNMQYLIQCQQVELSSTQSQSEISDILSTQSEPRLKVFSSPRPLSAGCNQLPRSHPKMEEDDLLDAVRSESTLFSPSKIDQIRNRFTQQREQALSKSREMSPTLWSPQRRPGQSGSPSKRRLDYELKLANLEEKMAAERKTQVDLLKGKHERDLAEIEKKCKRERAEFRAKLRTQLEEEHSQKTKQAVADCLAESDKALIAARKEQVLEQSHQKQISQLRSSHQTEITTIETDHNAKIEALAAKYKEELSKIELINLGATQEQNAETLEEQALHHKVEMESLHAQFQSELEVQMNGLREKLKQECMAKFKTMADKLQQIHKEEVDTIKQESITHEDNLQLQRDELEAEQERNMVIVIEDHKNEIKTLRDGNEEQLRVAEIDHAHRVRTINAQQDDQSEQLELTVRYGMYSDKENIAFFCCSADFRV